MKGKIGDKLAIKFTDYDQSQSKTEKHNLIKKKKTKNILTKVITCMYIEDKKNIKMFAFYLLAFVKRVTCF